jgi:Tol biopolymer transport system component
LLLWPRQVLFSPAAGSTGQPPLTPLRLDFFQAMRAESVLERLQISPPHSGVLEWQDQSLIFTPGEPWPSGATVTITLAAGARSNLGLPMLGDRRWSFSVSRPQVAYLWPLNGSSNLYLLDPFSGETEQLTTSAEGVLDFDVLEASGDIVYALRSGAGSSLWRWVRLADRHERLLECPQTLCDGLQVSPDESWLAYVRSVPGAQVWLHPLAGGEPRRLGDPDHQVGQPGWSPQGWLSYYDGSEQAFYFVNLDGTDQLSLPHETGEPLSWAPDGSAFVTSEVLFLEAGPADYASHLVRYTFPGLQRTDLSVLTNLEDASPVYSPDGRWLAFNRKSLDPAAWTPGRQLWLMHPDGRAARQLTNEPPYGFSSFAWSPDSRWLAYLRSNWTALNEPTEIWLVDPDGTEMLRLWIDGYAPQWLP